MSKLLQSVMTFLAATWLCTAAFGANEKIDGQDVEVKFGIQLTRALNNDAQAQFVVAEMYEQGLGTPRNLRMAHLWYTKSAKQRYAPAIKRLESWEKVKQESEGAARQRAAEEQKHRQAEAAAAAKAAQEEAAARTARQRAAEEQKRRQAEAAAAAAAKAAREEAAAKTAREHAAEEQKRRQAEAEAAAAAAKAAQEEAAKTSKAAEVPPIAKDNPPERLKEIPKESKAKSSEKPSEEFRANPCKTPTAKFTSVCQ